MQIAYRGKKTSKQILTGVKTAKLSGRADADCKLVLGDNLEVMMTLLKEYNLKGKVDLVYIDPPFATNSNFNIGVNRVSTVSKSTGDAIAYSDKLLGADFLEFLRERLELLHELLSDKGSIYLHIDYKIGHYVKIIMDEVFGIENFHNDITRIKCNPKNFHRKSYGNIKDMILFYTKGKNAVWNIPYEPFTKEDSARLFKKVDSDGRKYTTIPLHAPGETKNGKTGQRWKGLPPPEGRHWRCDPAILDQWDKEGLIEWSKNGVPRKKIYSDERDGKRFQDIWEFKDPQYPNYPTEKNAKLLELIINTSSNKGDLVLDCFCGSGTTLVAAQKLGRNWIGIDSSPHAIRVAQKRLAEQEKLLSLETKFETLKQVKP